MSSLPAVPKIGKIQAREQQVYWDQFFTSEDYRVNLKERIKRGKAPHMETLLHHMTYGKPKETLELQGSGDGEFILVIAGVEVRSQSIVDGVVKAIAGEQSLADAATPASLVLTLEPMDDGEFGDVQAEAMAACRAVFE